MNEHRRKRLLEEMGPDAVALLVGARPARRSADTEYPFRQDSDFSYLTGFDHPNACAVLRTNGEPVYTLFVEPRDRDAEIWNGYRPGVEGALRDYGADAAHPNSELLDALPKLVSGVRRVYHVLGRAPAIDARLLETIESLRLRSRAGVAPPAEIADPRALVHEMRLHKEPAELDVMRRAAAISLEAHAAAARLAWAGTWEYELQAELEYTFRRRGASGPAYAPIVGGGANATVLHYTTNADKLRDGELVLVDAGCELENYASDVTRTYPVGGRFVGPAREVYEAVLAAQQAAFEQCRPGRTLAEVHDAAVRSLVASLVEIGLLSGDVDELIVSEAYRRYYMHSTSHWLGLDVHDVGSYRVAGEHRKLEPGMVFTVEPGLYVARDDEQADPRFRGIGVRLEDDVVVTQEGHENLTGGLAKLPEDVEALVSDR